MNIQEKYWNMLVQYRFDSFYFIKYLEHSYKWDKMLNIILAITASTSIAAWAIWMKYPFIWSCLIAFSQVINAIRPFLPTIKRIKAINMFNNEFAILLNKIEYDWHKVNNGTLTESKINELIFNSKNQYNTLNIKHFSNLYLPINKSVSEYANYHTKIYFMDMYNCEDYSQINKIKLSSKRLCNKKTPPVKFCPKMPKVMPVKLVNKKIKS